MDAAAQTRKLTAKEFWDLCCEDEKWQRYELDDGELIEMPPPGPIHGITEAKVVTFLGSFLEDHPLGLLMCGDPGFELDEDRVRAPDVAFIGNERLAATPVPTQGWYPGAPDLAVEVISPSDRAGEMLNKIRRWLEAGVRLVWVVDPQHRTVTVYRADRPVTVLGERDTLSGEDVLPGFACPVVRLFPAPPAVKPAP